MFYLGNDDVALGGVCHRRRGDCRIVAPCRARSEDDIHRVSADQFGHLLARRPGHGKSRSSAGAQDDSLGGAALDGLPHSVVRYGIMASNTSGKIGVVALWSR